MNYEMVTYLIGAIFMGLLAVGIPFLKSKGLTLLTLLMVNIIEQICEFMEISGNGQKKYAFVKKVLLMISPKLTDEQIETLIESMVIRMKEVKESLK